MTMLACIEICMDNGWTERIEELATMLESLKAYPENGKDHKAELVRWEDAVMAGYFEHLAELKRVPDADEIAAKNPSMGDEE